MKTFITGATGFIGSHVAKLLAERKHELCCLVRKPSPKVEQLKALGARLVVGDVRDRESVFRAMKGSEWVIHLAGLYSYWVPTKQDFADVNITGTRNVIECALETGVSKVVHVSSVVILGEPEDSPFTEESLPGAVRFSEYSRTKYEGDKTV